MYINYVLINVYITVYTRRWRSLLERSPGMRRVWCSNSSHDRPKSLKKAWQLYFSIYTQPSLPLSSEGSLACHTYFDTGHPFIIVIFEDTRDTHTCCQRFGSGAVNICFNDLCLSRSGIEPRFPACKLVGIYSPAIVTSPYALQIFAVDEKPKLT